MRPSNVLVRKNGATFDVRFIDFDWAGVAGVVVQLYATSLPRRAAALNEDAFRGVGARACAAITEEHDRAWLEIPAA